MLTSRSKKTSLFVLIAVSIVFTVFAILIALFGDYRMNYRSAATTKSEWWYIGIGIYTHDCTATYTGETDPYYVGETWITGLDNSERSTPATFEYTVSLTESYEFKVNAQSGINLEAIKGELGTSYTFGQSYSVTSSYSTTVDAYDTLDVKTRTNGVDKFFTLSETTTLYFPFVYSSPTYTTSESTVTYYYDIVVFI